MIQLYVGTVHLKISNLEKNVREGKTVIYTIPRTGTNFCQNSPTQTGSFRVPTTVHM